MKLKEARERAGLSMEALAEKAGVTGATICRYEQGKRVPKITIAKRLGEILGIEWYEVMDTQKGA